MLGACSVLRAFARRTTRNAQGWPAKGKEDAKDGKGSEPKERGRFKTCTLSVRCYTASSTWGHAVLRVFVKNNHLYQYAKNKQVPNGTPSIAHRDTRCPNTALWLCGAICTHTSPSETRRSRGRCTLAAPCASRGSYQRSPPLPPPLILRPYPARIMSFPPECSGVSHRLHSFNPVSLADTPSPLRASQEHLV